jgi:hypothetical protein
VYDTIRPHRYPFTFLIFAPIIIAPDWSKLFVVMCDARDFAIGVMLGQRHDKIFHSIYHAKRTPNEAQLN